MDELYSLDVMPMSRVVWKLSRDSLLDKSKLIDLSRDCWLAELRTVSEKLRKCATIHVRSEYIKEDLELLQSMNLVFIPLRKCRRVRGFAHRFYDPEPGEPYDIYGVVARDIKDALKFKRAHLAAKTDNTLIGKLLGYPECCIKFFNKIWNRSYDPIWDAAVNTKGLRNNLDIYIKSYPECNILLRYFGIRAVPHLVCSFKCKNSLELANMFLSVMKYRSLLIKVLESPIVWDCYKGIAIVDTKWFIGIANSMPYKLKHIS